MLFTHLRLLFCLCMGLEVVQLVFSGHPKYGTAGEQVYIKLRALARAQAEFLRVLASDLRARASQSLCLRVICVCTPIARVRNTRERLSMQVRNTNLSAREQCKHVPRYVRIFSCTTSSSSF